MVADIASVLADFGYALRSGVEAVGVKRDRLMGEPSKRDDRDVSVGGVSSDFRLGKGDGRFCSDGGIRGVVSGMIRGVRYFGESGPKLGDVRIGYALSIARETASISLLFKTS